MNGCRKQMGWSKSALFSEVLENKNIFEPHQQAKVIHFLDGVA